MEITKIETNLRKNLFLKEYKNIHPKEYKESVEFNVINIYEDIYYQEFIGFGGAFTDSSGYSFSLLNNEKQDSFINDYFNNNYSLGRIPIASSDFSTHSYSYSEKEDLSDFNIEEDKKYIIPLIKKALEKNPHLKFLASPWSPPKFMKSNNTRLLGGKLKKEFYKTYAKYLVKFIKAYKKEHINIDYITIQNEPNATQVWESCLFNAEEEYDFLLNYLYPEFKKEKIKTKILIWDHNKEKLYTRAKKELTTKTENIIDGIAYHYYTGDHFENINILKEKYPNKLLIHTEGCTAFSKFKKDNLLKSAEIYAHDIIGDLNHGANAYIDWNLILDHKGGPNHKFNYCDSPIMLNKKHDDFIKNLSYYYISHFSKFIKPGAHRIAFSKFTDQIEMTAFKNKDKSLIIVLFNKNDFNKEYNLVLNDKVLHDNLDKHAIVTYVIKL